MCVEVADLLKPCPFENLGGIQKVEFYLAHEVFSLTVDENNYRVIYIFSNAQPKTLYFTEESGEYRESANRTDAGKHYKQTLRLKVPQDREEVAAWIDGMGDDPLIMLYTDENGKKKIVGSPQEPVELDDELNTGRKNSEYNGHEFVFTCLSRKKAYFFEADPIKVYNVTVTAGAGGTATNLGVNQVALGDTFETIIIPNVDDGYRILSIYVDGVAVTGFDDTGHTVSFEVTGNHEVDVLFVRLFSVTTSLLSNSEILGITVNTNNSNGSYMVTHKTGADIGLMIMPAFGKTLSSITVTSGGSTTNITPIISSGQLITVQAGYVININFST